MKKIILYIVLGVLAAVLLINILRPNKVQYGTKAEIEVPKASVAADTKIKSVIFLIDNSGSMKGYAQLAGLETTNVKSTDFVANTGKFMTNCKAKFDAGTKALCNKEYNVTDMIKALGDGSAFSGPITELDAMFIEAAELANDSTVCVIVSDMVLSYGKAKLLSTNNNRYNLEKLDQLQGLLYDSFVNLKKDNKSVMIVKYLGNYNGTYYCNYTENLETNTYSGQLMEDRPYYFAVVGDDAALKDICNLNVLPDGYKALYNTLQMTDADYTAEPYTVSQPESQVPWILGALTEDSDAADRTFTITQSKNLRETAASFTFAFDRFDIPKYIMLNDTTIASTYPEKVLSKVDLTDNSKIEITTKNYKDLDNVNDVTIEFSVPRYADYSDTNTLDDVTADLDSLKGKTWGFEAVVKALYEAYNIQKTDVVKIAEIQFVIQK